MANPYDGKKRIGIPNEPLVYKDNADEWRWQIKCIRNNKIIGSSSEGFSSKQMALNNLKLVARDIDGYYDKEKDENE